MRALGALLGLACALLFLVTVLRALVELLHQWAGEQSDPVPPKAEHPYEPNGGALGAAPTFPAPVAYPPARIAGPRINGTLPGRRKDNTDDRSAADPSNLPN